ncbi:MAG: glycoside hydrolase family 18 protein [Caldicoprobacterales bacterium]
MVIHTVEQGQTIEEIAQVYGVTTQSIIDINGLTEPENLVTGMNLVIPISDPSFIISNVHVVKENESLWSLSKRYRVPLKKLIIQNHILPPYIIHPGQIISIMQNGPPIETLGYLNPIAASDPAALIREIGPSLTWLGLFEFPVSRTGEIFGTVNEEILSAAREVGTGVLPVITNQEEGAFDSDLARELISSDENKQQLFTNVTAMLNQYDMPGLLVDFENLYPEDRDLFTQFIEELVNVLHENGKILVLNLAPKWEDQPDAPWTGFFDYSALGAIVDRAAIMTYEWGYVTGPPTPTAPIGNVRRVLEYALANNIPAEKILMGMTLYGYNWELPDTPENRASTVTQPTVWDLARRYNAIIEFDETAGQPFMNYTDDEGREHIVWFEDAMSHFLLYQLAQELGIGGVFYWIIHMPFPSTYYMVNQLFTVMKY